MKKLGVTKRMTWQEHLKRCAKTWQAKKKREGLSGVQASIQKKRSTFWKMLSVFKTHFSVRNRIVKTAMAAPAPAETP